MKQNMFLGQDDKKIKQVYAYIYAKKLTLLLGFFLHECLFDTNLWKIVYSICKYNDNQLES